MPEYPMPLSARKLRDAYAITSGAPFYQCEFGNGYFFTLERWKKEGMPQDVPMRELFGWDERGDFDLGGYLGSNILVPPYEEAVLEELSDRVIYRDSLGQVLARPDPCPPAFMPQVLRSAVTDRRSWEEDVKPRMDAATPQRYEGFEKHFAEAKAAADRGRMIVQGLDGFMMVRFLLGAEGLFQMIYEDPDLVHDIMRTWFEVADRAIAFNQQRVTLDEFFFKEDTCFNKGLLVSPDIMREFFWPYYQQLISNVRSRQMDKSRHLYIHVDTDGWCVPAIPLYMELGMEYMSPFEVASGCEVVEIGRQFPNLVMSGGIDKRILAKGKDAIDTELRRIFPVMKARGGYIPTCDHGVPEDVSYENYLHYRHRCVEWGN
jgi:uroporphyrinogen decarboxylase